MKRWHREASMMRRRQLEDAKSNLEQKDSDSPLGRFRKMKLHDCGISRCYLCHGSKLYDMVTPSRLVEDEAFREQMDDLYELGLGTPTRAR
ncbi:MAG: hypothetical protein HY986_10770 [Candidatus Melainabacteria bacterium]|nr:hypothetical protein [Candidatus Melainabacteria bacterium]